jgi:hypothetical protein
MAAVVREVCVAELTGSGQLAELLVDLRAKNQGMRDAGGWSLLRSVRGRDVSH